MGFRFYNHPAGVEAPSVTSLLGGVGEERLYNWRLKNALKYIKDENIDLSVPKAVEMVFDIVQDLSIVEADLGKWLHVYAEFYFAGKPTDILYDRAVLSSIITDLEHDVLYKRDTLEIMERNFLKFIASLGQYKVIASEEEVHADMDGPLGLPAYYSGKLDTILQQNRRNALLDFKTSWQAYDNHAAQVAAYGYGWNNDQKMMGGTDLVNALWVVTIGRTKNAKPFNITIITGDHAKRALELFRTALNLWYLRSGRWGDILPPKNDEEF